MIRAANNAYYCNQDPLMTDNQYDILREYTQHAFPGNVAAEEGHTECAIVKNKVKLPYEMWSMDKIKPDTEALKKWKQKYSGPYVLSTKLDGVSGLYSTEGPKPMLYTRGNGKIGQDVSHLIPYLRLPKTPGLVIRGEFIVSKAIFNDKYADKFSNSRNFVAGVVNQKTADKEKYKDIDFVSYELIKPVGRPSGQFDFLMKENIEVAQMAEIDKAKLTNEALSELLIDWRDNYKYEIDGVICIDNNIYSRTTGNPDHAFAFKMVLSDQVAETKVLDVIWTASKHGLLKPRVQIDPVILGGAKIEYATGFNAKFISENMIGVGALIRIVRSGDVIPHILSVTQPADEPQMPSVPYKWNNTHVDIVLKSIDTDPVVREKVIVAFFKAIGVEGLKAGNVRRIIDAGYDTIADIIHMSKSEFYDVEGFKEKTVEKLYAGIHKAIDEASLPQLMHASNIFGRGFGTRRFQAILEAYPDILVSTLPEEEKEKNVNSVHGMAKKTSQQFIEELPDFVEWMHEVQLEDKLIYHTESPIENTGHPLYGKKIVTTGIDSKVKAMLTAKFKEIGAILDTSVKQDTYIVLVNNLDEDTQKAEKARKLKIPLVLIEKFVSSYNLY